MNNIIKGIKLILSGLLSPFTAVINGIKELMYVGLRVQHIEENLMYDNTPDVLSQKLLNIEHTLTNRMDGLAEINKSMREKINTIQHYHIDNDISVRIDKLKKRIDNVFETLNVLHDSSINELNKRLKKLEDENKTHINCFNGSESSHLSYLINELQLSLESLTSKDLGTFNFINDKLTQPELDMIESEAKGELVVKEENDWHYEQKAKDKQIQDRMRKDEAKLIW